MENNSKYLPVQRSMCLSKVEQFSSFHFTISQFLICFNLMFHFRCTITIHPHCTQSIFSIYWLDTNDDHRNQMSYSIAFTWNVSINDVFIFWDFGFRISNFPIPMTMRVTLEVKYDNNALVFDLGQLLNFKSMILIYLHFIMAVKEQNFSIKLFHASSFLFSEICISVARQRPCRQIQILYSLKFNCWYSYAFITMDHSANDRCECILYNISNSDWTQAYKRWKMNPSKHCTIDF